MSRFLRVRGRAIANGPPWARNVQVRPPVTGVLDDLLGRMDRVLVDAPCTGTGVWRRRPDSKWRLTAEALERRVAEQDSVLRQAARFVRPGGVLAYATCSVLREENDDRVAAFRADHPAFVPVGIGRAWEAALPDIDPPALGAESLLLTPLRTDTDGFFLALLKRQG